MRRRKSAGSPVSLFSLQDIIMCLTGIMILLVLMLSLQTVAGGFAAASDSEETPVDLKAQIEEARKQLESLEKELTARLAAIEASQETNPMETSRKLQSARREESDLKKEEERLDERITVLEEEMKKQETAKMSEKAEIESLERRIAESEEDAKDRAVRPIAFIPDSGTSKAAHLVECSSNVVRVISLGNPTRNTEWPAGVAEEKFESLLSSCESAKEYFVFMMKPSGVPAGMRMFYLSKNKGFEAGYDALEEDSGVMGGAP